MTEHFMIGCCYYPEHWEKEGIKEDIKRIKALGFNTIRMGEFSWSMYEKEEGKYDFSVLEEAVKAAGEYGIDVILGTPTASPPKWLTDRYPEVLCRDRKGTLMQHGSRQHHNHTSEVYLDFCKKITEAMVKHFSAFKNVIGWQIDNEFNCHRNESYAEADDIAFRKWLEEKYKTIDELNEAWGNRFWSLEYGDFSEITCPRPTPTWDNPSFMTDYYLFLSDSVINYASVQAKVIRKYMPDAFITHNGYFENIDYKKLTDKCLDILGFDSYPAFNEQYGEGQGRVAAYRLSQTHGICDKFLVLEQQAGPGGQNGYLLPTPLPGQIRLWTYQSIAYGAVCVIYFRYRTALFGAEQLWYGIYDHDLEENYRSREIRMISEELSRVGDIFINNRQKYDVAIYYDYHNISADKTENFVKNDIWEIYTELNKNNIHADFLYDADRMDKYKVIIFPHLAIADKELAEKIEKFASKGGVAILNARSGIKDKNDKYYPQKAPGVFKKAAGCRVDWFTKKTDHDNQSVNMFGKTYPVSDYYEMVVSEGAEEIGKYTGGFLKGKTAAVKNGNIYYIGFYSAGAEDIYVDLIKKHINISEPKDKDLEEFDLGDYRLYLNHSHRDISLSGYDLISGKEIASVGAFGVALFENKQ